MSYLIRMKQDNTKECNVDGLFYQKLYTRNPMVYTRLKDITHIRR